jgi:hypothetical protein
MQIKAIETRYEGYRFRSRLEARWGVYLDALGWVWDYEPEGFEVANGTRYLPDFLLCNPAGNPCLWLEIKSSAPSEAEKLKMLVAATGRSGAFGIGLPKASNETNNDGFFGIPGWVWMDEEIEGVFKLVRFTVDIIHGALSRRGTYGLDAGWDPLPIDYVAVAKAKAARFEFGENG